MFVIRRDTRIESMGGLAPGVVAPGRVAPEGVVLDGVAPDGVVFLKYKTP